MPRKLKKLIVNHIGDDPVPTQLDSHFESNKDTVVNMLKLACSVALLGEGTLNVNSKGLQHNGETLPDAVYTVNWGFPSYWRNWVLSVKTVFLALDVARGRNPGRTIVATGVTTVGGPQYQ